MEIHKGEHHMRYSMSEARQAEAEHTTHAEADELEAARPPRHAPPRPARRPGRPASTPRPDREPR